MTDTTKDQLKQFRKLLATECTESAAPVVFKIIQTLQSQVDYSRTLTEWFKKPGFEILDPQRIESYPYHLVSKHPEASGAIGLISLPMVAMFPLTTSMVLGTLAAGTFAWLSMYRGEAIKDDQETLLGMQSQISSFIQDLINAGRYFGTIEGVSAQEGQEEALLHQKVQRLKSLCVDDLYLPLRSSKPVRQHSLLKILELCQELFARDAKELYFHEVWIRNQGQQLIPAKPNYAQEPQLNLGQPPKETSREDAIAEGISIARELSRARKRSQSKKPRPGSPRETAKAEAQDSILEAMSVSTPIKPEEPLAEQPFGEPESPEPMAAPEATQEASEATDVPDRDPEQAKQENDEPSKSGPVDGSEESPGASGSGDDVELVVAKEVVENLFDEEDVEVLGELNRMNSDRLKALDDSKDSEDSEDSEAASEASEASESTEDQSKGDGDDDDSEYAYEEFADSLDDLPEDDGDLPSTDSVGDSEDDDFELDNLINDIERESR